MFHGSTSHFKYLEIEIRFIDNKFSKYVFEYLEACKNHSSIFFLGLVLYSGIEIYQYYQFAWYKLVLFVSIYVRLRVLMNVSMFQSYLFFVSVTFHNKFTCLSKTAPEKFDRKSCLHSQFETAIHAKQWDGKVFSCWS